MENWREEEIPLREKKNGSSCRCFITKKKGKTDRIEETRKSIEDQTENKKKKRWKNLQAK